MQAAARLSASVQLPVPAMRDQSWVPAMRPSAVDFAMTNMAVDFNKSTESTTFAVVPVRLLRAQHFVRAFEVGGEFGPRSYAPDMKDASRFSELDTRMDWATAALRQIYGSMDLS